MPLSNALSVTDTDVSWKEEGLCWDIDPDEAWPIFFPISYRPKDTHKAKAICEKCPIKKMCAVYAVVNGTIGSDFGVWGGTTPRQRDRVRDAYKIKGYRTRNQNEVIWKMLMEAGDIEK